MKCSAIFMFVSASEQLTTLYAGTIFVSMLNCQSTNHLYSITNSVFYDIINKGSGVVGV